MNEDMEKKLDQLLADMPKREYDLDAWLAEDETATFDRIVSEQKKPEENAPASFVAKIKPLHRWIAVAAYLVLIIGIAATLWPKEEQSTAPLTAKKTEQPQTEPKSPSSDNTTEEIRVADNDKQRESEPTPAEEPAVTKEELNPVTIPDPNLHYAALATVEDSVPYQNPSRVDDFITELAQYYKVKAVPLSCTSDTGEGTIVCTAYLFKDEQELDLFARLLQVACWYNSKTPGYLLNFSQERFFFKLEDPRKDEKCLWMAERIGKEYVLLFSTHYPKNVTLSSACFQEYREQLTHITPKTLNI